VASKENQRRRRRIASSSAQPIRVESIGSTSPALIALARLLARQAARDFGRLRARVNPPCKSPLMSKRGLALSTPLMSVAEAADFLRVGARTVLNEIDRGNLRAGKVGRQWRIKENDLHAYWQSRYMAPNPKRTKSDI
jgi:excisionase family DNA binding protein